MIAPVTLRAVVDRIPRALTVHPYRIAGLWVHDGSWGPMLARGDALTAARTIAHRLGWPAPFVEALA